MEARDLALDLAQRKFRILSLLLVGFSSHTVGKRLIHKCKFFDTSLRLGVLLIKKKNYLKVEPMKVNNFNFDKNIWGK